MLSLEDAYAQYLADRAAVRERDGLANRAMISIDPAVFNPPLVLPTVSSLCPDKGCAQKRDDTIDHAAKPGFPGWLINPKPRPLAHPPLPPLVLPTVSNLCPADDCA